MLSELLSLLVCHCVLSVINKEIIIIIIIINYSFSATCYIAWRAYATTVTSVCL